MARRLNSRGWFVVCLGAAVLTTCVWRVVAVATEPAKSDVDARAPVRLVATTQSTATPLDAPRPCKLNLPDSPIVPVFPTEAGLDEWFHGAANNVGSDALATIRRANNGLLVDSGTACSFVDRGFQKSQIRILAGPHEGKAGWVFSDWTRPPSADAR